MKRIIFLFMVSLLSNKIGAQTNADCINAIPLCTTPNFTFFAGAGNGNVDDIPNGSNVSNPSTNPASQNSGCLLAGENVPQWLLITIGNPGTLEFVFGAGNSPNPQVGCYDWAMWPYSPATCSQIMNNILPPIRCNWNSPCNGGTGIASAATYTTFGGFAGSFEPPLQVSACQQFIICISNYSGVNTLVSFQSLGTASLICNPNCNPSYEICAGSNATVVPVNFSALANPTYSMNPGGITSATGSFVVSPLTTTSYTTFITGTNANNAVQTITAVSNVTVNPQPLVTMTQTQTTCTSTLNGINVGLNFNPSLPVPGYTISWLPVPPAGVTNPTQTAISGGITPATYTAIVTAAGGCSAVAVSTINPPPAPSVFTLNPPGGAYTVSCSQPTVFLDATAATYNYTWTNGVVAPQYVVSTSYDQFGLGSWTVTGQNPVSGCLSSKVFSVSLNQTAPSSLAAPVNQNILCGPGVVATVTGTAISPTLNVTHSWYSPGIDVPVEGGGQYSIFSLGAPGTYTYVLTDNVNGCSTTKTVQVTSNLGYPTFNVSSLANFTLGCSTKSVTDAHIVDPNTTPLSGGSMSFAVLPPGFSQPTYTYSSVLDYSFTVPGNYTFIVQDINNQCETRITVPIIQDVFTPNATVNAATRTLTCRMPSVVLEGVSTTTPVVYSWSFQNGSNPNTVPNATTTVQSTTNTAISATVVNVYTLTVTNTNNLCKTTTLVPIYQNIRPPKPKINGAGALDCITFEQTLVNGSTLDEAPGFFAPLGTAVTKWEGPSPQVDNVDTVASYKARTVGVYTMTVMDRNNGCMTQTTVVVGDNRIYPVLQTNTQVALDCGASNTGVSLSVTAVGLKASDVTAQWTAPVPTPNIKNANTLTLTTDGVGLYRLTVTTNSNGCTSRTYVTVINGVLTGGFSADQETGYAPLTVNFSNTSSSTSSITGTSSITSVWSFGNGTTRTTTTSVGTSAIYSQPGTYTVTMFASKGSCSDTVYKVIRVDIPSKLEVPNVFTPNGDNSNDIFFIKAANLTEITALIYDRWGNKVYELTTDKGNIAWDGKNLTGKESPDGTYFYIITAKGKDGQSYDTKGTVSLYR